MSTAPKIKRWSRDQKVDCMFESNHGKWVRAKDHDAAVALLYAEIELLRTLLRQATAPVDQTPGPLRFGED